MTPQLPRPGLAGVAAVEISADTISPVTAALRLHDQQRLAFILESVEGGARYGRYSMVGVRGRYLCFDDGVATVHAHDYSEIDRFSEADPLEALRRFLPPVPMHGSPLPVSLASGVGYLSYEAAARWEKLPVPRADPIGLPEALFHLPDVLIVFDHLSQTATLATIEGAGAGERLADAAAMLATPSRIEGSVPIPSAATRPQPPAADARYEAGVASLVRDIHAGEMLQAVLARRFSLPCSVGPLQIYRSLRRINPSPHLFAIDLGPERSVLGASPELLVRVRDGVVATRPIAGTRPRSADPQVDRELEADLLGDEKELAEHAMLVDLARNDVGRVAIPGSVRVPSLHAIERYSHVMHIVSEVEGAIADGHDAFDAVRSVFPAGTLSGAPKMRAMQAIAELEQERRGPYGGAIGFFAPDDVEVAITIRSMVLKDGMAHVHAGAGIVADSVPERESAEVAAKAGAILSAIADAQAIQGTEADR
ncbi:MAG: anthranilate synthase component I family protein [Candidatus Limnocylindrales bacterium]|jgi:anthranilate synthase component 1